MRPWERSERGPIREGGAVMGTLYADLKAAGCTLGNHESDLHVKLCPQAIHVLREHSMAEYRPAGPSRGEPWIKLTGCSQFRSEVDGTLWIEIPFAFAPFWNRGEGVRPC